ncbi:MAG: adenine deaminase [Elusimicrobia bacterium CG06_land_8_20_14_3_00_38_11]|nr:MAG: adenine deaminase [Elusimicrobia bacterium CG06_land_8_20_14_3_00_38_11]
MNIREIIKAANGEITVDLLLKNGKLINVFSGEIRTESVAIHKGFVVGFGNYKAKKVLNLGGKYIAPGFIDGHVHIESSMMSVSEFARAVVPRGVTSVITDAHEIANVLGIDGIKYMLESSKNQPLNVFFMLPSCVPATNMETAGARLTGFDLYPFLREKWVVGLGEVMNFPGVISADDDLLNKMKIASGKRVDGHSPGLVGKALSSYIASGIASDHESTTMPEAKEKLEKGMYVMVREGTSEKNLKDIIPLVNEKNYSRFFFVTDDRHPQDLVKEGSVDFIVRYAISLGLAPVTAIKMATLNTAEYFRLPRIGAVAPGYQADIVILNNLKDIKPVMVFRRGELVSVNGEFVAKKVKLAGMLRGSINVRWLTEKDFRIPVLKKNIHVIEIVPHQIVTKKRIFPARVEKKFVVSDIKKDVLKLVVVERHLASGNIGKGFVKGFGLKKGAIASSVSHDSHNIICVGVDDKSIFTACVEIVKMGGGLCIADGEKILGRIPLPIAGLMTDKPLEKVVSELEKLVAVTKKLGCKLDDPFMTLSFLALPVIPELKLTDKGLVDVSKMKLVELFV